MLGKLVVSRKDSIYDGGDGVTMKKKCCSGACISHTKNIAWLYNSVIDTTQRQIHRKLRFIVQNMACVF